jgi:hypothetical protein
VRNTARAATAAVITATGLALTVLAGTALAGTAPPAGTVRVPLERAAPGQGVSPAVSSVDSLNSAGYAVARKDTRFRFVKATFFVPYLNCSVTKSADSSDWVGLGGFVGSSDAVEQDGVTANCDKAGHASYRAWYAMYPRGVTTKSVEIRGGDSVTASVFYDAATAVFTLTVANNTTGGHFTVQTTCQHTNACPRESAEVITSAPTATKSGKVTVRRLADYGAVSYTSIAITSRSGERGGLRSPHWTATRIVQTEKDSPFRVIARPTSIGAGTFDSYWSRPS